MNRLRKAQIFFTGLLIFITILTVVLNHYSGGTRFSYGMLVGGAIMLGYFIYRAQLGISSGVDFNKLSLEQKKVELENVMGPKYIWVILLIIAAVISLLVNEYV